jgi:hypothetical protein
MNTASPAQLAGACFNSYLLANVVLNLLLHICHFYVGSQLVNCGSMADTWHTGGSDGGVDGMEQDRQQHSSAEAAAAAVCTH